MRLALFAAALLFQLTPSWADPITPLPFHKPALARRAIVGATIAGRFVDPQGRPQAGIRVQLETLLPREPPFMTTISGADGRFRFEGAISSGTIRIHWYGGDSWMDGATRCPQKVLKRWISATFASPRTRPCASRCGLRSRRSSRSISARQGGRSQRPNDRRGDRFNQRGCPGYHCCARAGRDADAHNHSAQTRAMTRRVTDRSRFNDGEFAPAAMPAKQGIGSSVGGRFVAPATITAVQTAQVNHFVGHGKLLIGASLRTL
jgi:hypothetical protein